MQICYNYKQIDSTELLPLFNNLLNVHASIPYRVYDIVVPFLMNLHHLLHHTSLPFQITGTYFVGSTLTNLYVTPFEHHDIDIKILIKGTHNVASQYFSFFEQAPFIAIEGNERNLLSLASETFKPVYLDSYSFKGYTIMGHEGHLPLEISLLVAEEEISIPTVMNVDSLFIPIRLFSSPSGYGLGSSSLDSFQLYSTQGPCDIVIEEVRNGKLFCQNPQSVKKFGWPRFILALIDGFISSDPALNQVFQEHDMQESETAIYSIYQFVQKKRFVHFPVFWILFICNAIFHSSRQEYLEKWIEQFTFLLGWSEHNLAWVSFLKMHLPKHFPKQNVPFLLSLFLPLFTESLSVKNHENKEWLQCMMGEWQKKFYILVPPLFSTCPDHLDNELSCFFQIEARPSFTYLEGELSIDETLIPFFASLSSFQEGSIGKEVLFGWLLLCPSLFRSLLLLGVMPSSFTDDRYIPLKKRLLLEEAKYSESSPLILKSTLFSFDLSLLSLEEKTFFIDQIQTHLTSFDESIECFSAPHSSLDIILALLPLCEGRDKSKIAVSGVRKILQKHQKDLRNMPSAGWKKFLQITQSLSLEHVKKGGAWKKILFGICDSLFQNESGSCREPVLSAVIEDLLRLSQLTWKDKEMWKEHFQIYSLIADRNFSQEQQALQALLDIQLDEEKLSYFNHLFRLYPHLLTRYVNYLVNAERSNEAIVLLGTQEDPFDLFCDILRLETSKTLEYLSIRLPYEKDERLMIGRLYARLYDQNPIAAVLEWRYFCQEGFASYFIEKAHQTIQDSFKYALLSRLQNPAFLRSNGFKAHLIISMFADSIPSEIIREYALAFIDQYDKVAIPAIPEQNAQARFYFPFLETSDLFSLTTKCIKLSSNDLFADIYDVMVDRGLEASCTLHLLSARNLKLADLSLNSLLLLLQAFAKLKEPPLEEVILRRVRDCIGNVSSKMKKQEVYVKGLPIIFQLVEFITNCPSDRFVQHLLLSEISERLVALLTKKKNRDSLEAASRLLTHVHNHRIAAPQELDLSCDVKALSYFLTSNCEIPPLLTMGFETFSLLINKLQQAPFSVSTEILPLLVRSVDTASKSLERNAVSWEMGRFIALLYAMCPQYVKNVSHHRVPEKLVLETLVSLLSITDNGIALCVISALLKELLRKNLLEGKFIHTIAEKIAEAHYSSFPRTCSLPRAYASLFMTDFFAEPIPLNVFVNMVVEPRKIETWNEEEVEILLLTFTTVVDGQLGMGAQEFFRENTRLSPILDAYLKMLEKARQMYLCPNLLVDFLNFPRSYFPQGNPIKNILCILTKLVKLKETRPYLPQDILSKRADKFVQDCMFGLQFLPAEAREALLPILRTL